MTTQTREVGDQFGARPQFHPTKRRHYGRLAIVLVAAAGLAAGAWLRLRPKPVVVTPVVRGSAIDAVYAVASVEAMDRVTVKAKVAGAIAELKVREGEFVKKGDVVAVIDSPALRFQLERGKADQWAASQQAATTSPQLAALEAQARATEASLKNARDEQARFARLASTGAVSPADLERATNNVAILEAQLMAQRAQVEGARVDLRARASGSSATVAELASRLADAEARAPIDGTVLVRLVDPGEVVPQNGALVSIGDIRKLVLECSVDEADIGRVRVGSKAAVSLHAFPKQIFHGEVFDIRPDADRAKKSFLVKVRLSDAPDGLRSGMSAEVNIIVAEHPNALLAPSEGVDVANSVWVVRGDRVERQAVEIGVRDMLRVEIVSGLAEGDQVVVSGADALEPRAKVTLTVQPPTTAAVAPKTTAGGGNL